MNSNPLLHVNSVAPRLASFGALLATVLAAMALPATSAAQESALSAGVTRSIPLAVTACGAWAPASAQRNPTQRELRCRFGISGPGRFGLAEHIDVPVYQPATPLPGTHVVGLIGMPRPLPGESYEQWEWRVHRTDFGPQVRRVHRELELLDPLFAARIQEFETQLARAGVRFNRRETWRSPERQAYLFQQGRSRPGAIVTATLTSWHTFQDEQGRPSGRAVDYDVPGSHMERFHRYAEAFEFRSYGADSNDPGHVYMVGERDVDGAELAFLRTLPRVDVVTLATGRPMNEIVSREQRAEYHRRSLEWVAGPFVPAPDPEVVVAWNRLPISGEVAGPTLPTQATEEVAASAPPAGLLQALIERLRSR